jgi:hypothetical protein
VELWGAKLLRRDHPRNRPTGVAQDYHSLPPSAGLEVLSDLPLTIGVVERVVDRLRGNAEARGLVTVDGHLDARCGCQEVRRDIGEPSERPVSKKQSDFLAPKQNFLIASHRLI